MKSSWLTFITTGGDFIVQMLHGKHPVMIAQPKPCVWSGPNRLTKDNWWSKSSHINTAICLAKHDWFAACDDRCVLGPLWLQSIREAMAGNYVVAGSYAKYHGMKVDGGKIIEHGKLDGEDGRQLAKNKPVPCQAASFFGCTWAAPLEWLLNINGASEQMDGTSMEDVIMGHHFTNAGYPLRYDSRMFITEDRTPDELGTPMRRSSRDKHPYDKNDRAWRALATIAKEKRANNGYDLRELRENILAGGEWPAVDPNAMDWWDGKPIKEWDLIP